MPIAHPENPLPQRLVADFEARVARRDVVEPPAPPSQEPAAVQARLDAWLLAQHGQRDRRSRTALVQMLLLLLRQPDASTAALQTATGYGPRGAARATLRLEALGLTEWFYRSRTRYHRLTRAGEDALLPVVTGAAGPVGR